MLGAARLQPEIVKQVKSAKKIMSQQRAPARKGLVGQGFFVAAFAVDFELPPHRVETDLKSNLHPTLFAPQDLRNTQSV